MVPDGKPSLFKIQKLSSSFVKIGKGEKHGKIRNNKRKIEDFEK
jgi:hypothetical protein